MAESLVGTYGVINRVNTTSGEAWHVNAKNGVGGRGVRVGYTGVPPAPSHIVTESTGQIIDSENSEQFITEGN